MKRAAALFSIVSVFAQIAPAFAQTPSGAVPTPSAMPAVNAACSLPDRAPQVVRAVEPRVSDMTGGPRGSDSLPREVVVEVAIDSSGAVAGERLYRSSGIDEFDRASMVAARKSTYAPAMLHCTTVESMYMVRGFVSNTFPRKMTPQFQCTRSNSDAAVLRAGVVRWPDGPKPSQPQSAVVRVELGSDGYIGSAEIYKSTGSVPLDRAALEAVAQSQFVPQCSNYAPVMSTFAYEVDFDPDAPSPLPSWTPSARCANPPQDAIITHAEPPEFPDAALSLDHRVRVILDVTVSPTGRFVAAKVVQSSGYDAIDNAAIRAATVALYAPKLVNCIAVQGTVKFVADVGPVGAQ